MKALPTNTARKMKKTPIGEIPVEWEVLPFGAIVESSQYGVSLESSPSGTVPMLRMNNLVDGRIDLTDLAYVVSDHKCLKDAMLNRNDLLFNRTNSLELVGKTALFNQPGEYTFASYLVRFNLKPTASDPRFVDYFFNTEDSRKRLRRLATLGVSQCNINPTTLQKFFYIPRPPLHEQCQIADILGSWDEAIAEQGRIVSAKRRLKAGLMQQLLTGKRRFPAFGKKKGAGWTRYRLGELFDERKETGRGDLPLLSITADRGIVNREDLEKKDTSNADKSKYLRIAPGDIGYNTMRMWQGVSALSELEGIVSPAYTVCIPKADKIDGRFAAFLFKYQPVVHDFWRYSQGMVDDTLNLKFHNFAEVHVRIPGLAEQQAIADVLAECDRELAVLERGFSALREQKKGLMQQLLTGRIRVAVPVGAQRNDDSRPSSETPDKSRKWKSKK